MKIKKIEIDSFGKLKNISMLFNGGIQILYGENERGKSTLMEFIKIMLYGDMGRNINTSFRASKCPWGGGRLGGILEFENDNKLYKIQKQFDVKSPSKDKVLFVCLSNGKSISLGKREEIGERVLGLSLEDFERSGYISCLGDYAFNSGKSAKDMILNLISTGDKNVSKEKSDKYLDDAIKKLRHKNNNGGEIITLGEEIVKLQDTLYEREKIRNQDEEINKYISEVEFKIKRKNELKKMLEYINLSDRLEKLKEVVTLSQQRDLLRGKIGNTNFNFREAKQKLYECGKIYEQIQDIEKTITQIKQQIKKYNHIRISEHELEEIREYEDKIKKFTSALSDVDNTYLPEAGYLMDKYKSYKNKLDKIGSFQRSIKEQEYKISKYDESLKEYNKLIAENNVIEEQEKKESEKSEERQAIIFAKTKKYKKFIKFSSIIIISSFIALMVSLLWRKYLCTCFMFLIIIICVISNFYLVRKIKLFQKQKDRLNDDLKELLGKKQENIEKIEKLQGDISKLEAITYKYKEDTQLFNKYEIETNLDKINLHNEEHKLEMKLNELLEKLDINHEKVIEARQNIYTRFLNLSSEIKINKNSISNKLTQKLESKECNSPKEFFEKYNHILKAEGLKTLLISKERELEERKEFFIGTMQLYGKTDSFKQYIDKFNTLCNLIKEEQIKDINIKAFVKTLDLDSEDTSYIENTILETEKSINSIGAKYHSLNKKDVESINQEIENLESQNLEKRREELQGKIVVFSETIEEIKEKLRAKESVIKRKKLYLASLELAKALIDESYNELRVSFGNRINERASDIFKSLTSDKYNALTVQNDYSILIKTDIFDRKHDLFSSGTIDQAYLSLRLSLSEIISKNVAIPLILDDVLVRYDEERLYNTLRYLKKYSLENNAQIVIFTCHRYILQIGEKLEIPSTKLI